MSDELVPGDIVSVGLFVRLFFVFSLQLI